MTKVTSYGKMLTTPEVIHLVSQAIEDRRPFCLVRVGDGENLVLAQGRIMPIQTVMRTRWGTLSRTTNRKGIQLPNLQARDRLIQALKRADVIGIPYYDDSELLAPQKYLRPLTDRCFEVYRIRPKQVCHTLINRHLVAEREFWEMMAGRKVAMISKWAAAFAELVSQEYGDLDIDFVKNIPLTHYSQINSAVHEMNDVECDVALVSAGVNAVILAERLAREQQRVVLDFGKSAMFMVKGNQKRLRWWTQKWAT